MTAKDLSSRLNALADPASAAAAARFFKTAPGEYGHGDRFLGLNAAAMHRIAKEFRTLPLAELALVMQSEWHEERLAALLILVLKYARADAKLQKEIYNFYLAHTEYINNWDLVDCSARDVVGAHLRDKSRKPLDQLARSKSLWERRIAIVATHYFIRTGDCADTFRIAHRLLNDDEDLIHKAAGWMLREAGKRDQPALESFLREHHAAMPRTMLRYAIERFEPAKRVLFLRGLL